jgi:hypothetical protein
MGSQGAQQGQHAHTCGNPRGDDRRVHTRNLVHRGLAGGARGHHGWPGTEAAEDGLAVSGGQTAGYVIASADRRFGLLQLRVR